MLVLSATIDGLASCALDMHVVQMDVFIPKDRNTGDPRGFGFVTFHDRRDAEDAEEAMNECVFSFLSFFLYLVFDIVFFSLFFLLFCPFLCNF